MIGYDAIEHAVRTDVGVRRSHNQDAYGSQLAGDPVRWQAHGHLFIVADGMGGHAVGEKAAAKAARDIPHLVPKHAGDGPANALRKAFFETNAAIHNIGHENPEFRGLGTTASTLWLRPEGAWVGHVGDSRVYRLRAGMFEQLTFDHSAVWELAKRQGLKPEQMHGIRSNVILRSLGPEPLVEVDVEGPYPLLPGDTFLMCSDGLSGQLSDYEIGAILSVLPPQEACDFLVELANLRGGPDNITVMVVRVGGEPPLPAPAPGWRLRLPKLPWAVPTMGLGIVLAIAALLLVWLGVQKLGMFVFIVAFLCVVAGLIGLIVHSRRHIAEDLSDVPRQSIYASTRCTIEPALIEKLVHAEAGVVEKLNPTDIAESAAEVARHRVDASTARDHGDLPGAFRAHCRVMHALVRRFNQTRHKEEVFQPVWDKLG